MTPAELCRATMTSTLKPLRQPSLWALENNKTKSIKADTMFRIAGALRANPDWIRTGAGDPFQVSEGTTEEIVIKLNALSSDKRSMILAAIDALS